MSIRASIYATPKQETYIVTLRREARNKGVRPEWGPTTRYRMSRDEASRDIEMLRRVLGKSNS